MCCGKISQTEKKKFIFLPNAKVNSEQCLVQLASWGLRWQERKTMLQDGPQDGRRLGNPGVPSPGQVLVPRGDSPRHAR